MLTYKLYELSDAMERLNHMMEDGVDGLEDTLEAVEGSFDEKVESIVKLMKSKAATRDLIDAERQRLGKRAEALDRQVQWLNDYVEREMKRANKTEVKSALFSIKLGMNPPKVEVDGIEDIPPHYIRSTVTKTPDKIVIKEALLRGEIIPGCRLEQDLKLKVR